MNALIYILQNAALVTQYVSSTNIYPIEVNRNDSPNKYVTVNIQDTEQVETKDTSGGLVTYQVQVLAYARDFGGADRICRSIKSTLNRKTFKAGTYGYEYVQDILFQDQDNARLLDWYVYELIYQIDIREDMQGEIGDIKWKMSRNVFDFTWKSLLGSNLERTLRRDINSTLWENVSVAFTGDLTSGSSTVPVSSTANLVVGDKLEGTGIPTGTTIAAIGTGQITLSQNATADGTGVGVTALMPAYSFGTSSNEFILPDARGKMIRGADSNIQVGASGGSDSVTLQEANLPEHNHSASLSASASTNIAPYVNSGVATQNAAVGNYLAQTADLGKTPVYTYQGSQSGSDRMATMNEAGTVTGSVAVGNTGSGTSFNVINQSLGAIPYMKVL